MLWYVTVLEKKWQGCMKIVVFVFCNFKAHVMGYPAPGRIRKRIAKGGNLRNAEQVWII